MALEFICFIGGALVLLIPGIWLAGALALGNNRLERWATGSSLGLAMAVYVASAISHVDLRAFYPAWGIIGLACFIAWLRASGPIESAADSSVHIWMILILVLVGVSRFAMALPRVLPPGRLDPTFHLILARQIQITHHSIDRWPFANIPLNYPTGSNILVVVLSGFSRLPLHTTFKDLIPLLGVLTTAQMYVFSRRMTGNSLIGLYSAAIYGLWAWLGSIDYFRWGGLPNELAMLLFIAMLSVGGSSRGSMLAMALCFAGAVLVHHHVMVVSSIILVLIIFWQMIHGKPWRPMAISLATGLLLDLFFLLPYAFHLANFRATGMVVAGEPLLSLFDLPQSFGYVLFCAAAVGVVLSLARKVPCSPIVGIASFALVAMFAVGEDVIPLLLRALHRTAFTFFTPSRFLTDLNYFLPVFAAAAVLYFQRRFHIPAWIAMLFLLLAPIADYSQWIKIFSLYTVPPEMIAACDWIQHNTPPNTIVDNTGAWMGYFDNTPPGTNLDDKGAWLTYLCWREPAHIALPVSEPVTDYHAAEDRIPLILAGKIPPDSRNMMIVSIGDADSSGGKPILWKDSEGAAVIEEYGNEIPK
jgi:hypothetical protein